MIADSGNDLVRDVELTLWPKCVNRVTVYDIDPYLINLLGTIRDDFELDFEIVNQDLCQPLHGDLQERFDVFLTDPMSNNACFEIFLSRASSLLKKDGEGFVAVFPPAMDIFSTLAKEMNFRVQHWYRRFNRYYSHLLATHNYESDWVHVKKKADMVLHFPPDVTIPGFNLYREDYYNRAPSLSLTIEDIDDTKYAKPLFLEMLLDSILIETNVQEKGRKVYAGDNWSLLHSVVGDGYMTVYSLPKQRKIMLDLFPLDRENEHFVRSAFMRAFKAEPKRFRIISRQTNWHIRLS